MTGLARPAVLDALQNAALAADAEEKRFRAEVAAGIEAREAARRHAFRRYAFLKALVAADAAAPDREASRMAQATAAAGEFEWEEIDGARRTVIDALRPLADAVHDARLSGHGAEAGERVLAAFAAFEAWHEAERGRPFAEVFDRYVQETPLVDF
ncbi:hypothetical protein [Methylopila turkensis]|uniref:Uncharacterized protein n=1 Tax=Methylopila turkensis TaxID=1437816 RepID=A0A9W6JMY5_9HYPH|nr:hypothetical protein [Methylopila turkensis]GLK80595.1 hypothetical protein GCM10008174_23360 [Methylopila turkensis]